VAPNYRDAGISVFVVAYFVRDLAVLRSVREAPADDRIASPR
jgi:hypothetical protein